MQKLVEKGINTKEKDEKGRNGLMIALYNSRKLDLLEYLIQLGNNVNEKDNYGDTPLLLISRFANAAKRMKLLIDYGANVNIKDKKGLTAFDYVMKKDFPNEVQILKEAGAKLSKDLP